jgi:hypothetical protein
MTLEDLFAGPQYAARQDEKEKRLLPELIALTRHHVEHCAAYAKLVKLTTPKFETAMRLEELPYLPAGLFKTRDLRSLAPHDPHTILTSSGTSGQAASRIVIDDATARLQSRALAAVMRAAFGATRLPLLLIDSEAALKNRQTLDARAAGLLGFMTFGQAPIFALDDAMQLKKDAVAAFLKRHGGAPFLIFGFTFMVWRYFHQAMANAGFDCGNGTLVHSGGWKKLEGDAVDAKTFRTALKTSCGLTKIYNFYGMAEQMGTALLEGEDGLLYPPAFGDVIIRDAQNWRAVPPGTPGIVQVLSLVPHSYPGHSILTGDQGVIVSVDAGKGGRFGKAVRILGRAPRAELRGCGDIHALGAAA